jgi:hypothetical protein
MSRQGDIFERVSEYVERHPGCDAVEVCEAVPAIRGATDGALRRLERAGFVELRHGRYRLFKPYPLDLGTRGNGQSTTAATRPRRRSDDQEQPA